MSSALRGPGAAGGASAGRAPIEVRCPADGRIVGTVPDMSAGQVRAIAAGLRDAQPEWEALGFAGRRRWLAAFRDWLLDNEKRLHELVRDETGKAWGDLAMGEVTPSVDVLNYYLKNGERFLAPWHPRPHSPAMLTKRLTVTYDPHRLVGVITPWNAQLAMQMLDVPAALMAGCAVLTKASEETPLAWNEAVRGWSEDLGAPPVLDVVTGRGETGAAIVDAVDMIQFTGSVETGRRIGVRAAERLIPYSLELGGKDPMVVLADADLDRAVSAAVWGGLYNAGQICVSVERVYVEAPVYDEFVARVAEKVRSLRVGMDAPDEYGTDIGAIATANQLDIIESHVRDAVSKGAKVLVGGGRKEPGQFFEPTVLVDVDHTMDCMRAETFGPTLPIMKVADADEAVRLANDSDFGLAASVFGGDRVRARHVARLIDSGSVNINNAMTNVFQLPVPMGGRRGSGLGSPRLGGAEGIRKYTHPKPVIEERFRLKSELYWYPTTAKNSKLMSRATRFLGAKDWKRRLGR
ncbi:aldehyde dehydrogenase family protein [Amycolatopsis acidicola]|uniref:Aldehyde dehydrogenase family protein n=1 Tax=Amycolatopsis acidicola TaxID=2596893 RepID=A0A5N0V221_9PSEU|nr:aldehyde dehydrogenase family protein [Amycolatopsis acidicola]KAA9160479.1 aldehyde dehydrogenase family protein [Amycolatopsis acidicola]